MNCRLFFPVLLLTAVVLSAQTNATKEVEITAEPSHHLALENNYVRVFKVEVAPHAATLMHRHRHDYVFGDPWRVRSLERSRGQGAAHAQAAGW